MAIQIVIFGKYIFFMRDLFVEFIELFSKKKISFCASNRFITMETMESFSMDFLDVGKFKSSLYVSV